MDNLTNDAKYLISKIYETYIERRKLGQNKFQAVYFDSSMFIHKSFMPEWSFEDVDFTLQELESRDLISGYVIDEEYFGEVRLTTTAIAMLENRFSDNLESVLDFMSKVKAAIPFI